VDPLGIVCKQTAWYLVARTPAGMRTFRVSRMRNAMVLALSFRRPAKFDLATYWKRSTAAFKEQRHRYVATLALSSEAARTIEPWCAMVPAQRPGSERALPPDSQIFDVEFESLSHARFMVLGLGAGARAIGPDELAQQVAAEIIRMMNFQ
jgi:predicted DNA-binding transcriptional regulator YafY